MTTTSYLVAWFIYLLAACGFCALFWHISRNWSSILLRYWCRSTLIVLLCTPYFSDAAQNRLAPALLIALFELVFGDKSIALGAATPLALLLVLATILALVLALRHKKPAAVHKTIVIAASLALAMAFTGITTGKTSAEEAPFTPPELATGTFACNANWNQLCDEEKTITVPEGHILCQHHVSVTHQSGNSAYEITKVETNGITLKFHAKGNQDRFKQQKADIALQVSLLGVREGNDCTKKPEPHVVVIEKKLAPITLPPAPAVEVPVVAAPVVEPPKIHACACSQWNQSSIVETCLVQGSSGPKKKSCDTFNVKIQCVSDKETCQLIQRKTCQASIGLDPAQSFKRLFVANSLYCTQVPGTTP